MSLSDRVRGGSEAAPWVVDEIAKLEAERDRLAEAERVIELHYATPKPCGHDFDCICASDAARAFRSRTGGAGTGIDARCALSEDADGGEWNTACGEVLCFEEPPDYVRFCVYCGKPADVVPYVEPPICGECGEELVDGKCPECSEAAPWVVDEIAKLEAERDRLAEAENAEAVWARLCE